MKPMKQPVLIRIESVIDGARTVQEMRGDRYRREDGFVLRYEERNPSLGRTVTTLKYAAGEVRIVRHGDTEAELTYRPGKRVRGTYRTAEGALALENDTHAVRTDSGGGEERLHWTYDVYIDDARIGAYAITASIRET